MKRLTKVLVPLFLISLFAGCAAFQQYMNLTPLDKAIVNANQASVWYTETHKEITALYAQATPEKQLWYRQNVNPAMNKLKSAVITYVDVVSLWKATGAQPTNYLSILAQVNTLTNDVLGALGKNNRR